MSVRTVGRVVAFVGALALAVTFVPSANAADLPKTPQPVAEYFADGLIPRLIDLYGSGNGVTTGIDFDATTKVGTISRVREWTPDYLAGHASDDPTRLTNNWVAPVSVRDKVLGLATVWINPSSNQPELASFDSPELARQIAGAPQDSALIHDPAREAWFALMKDSLVALVPGSSGVIGVTTPSAYQRLISTVVPEEQAKPTGVAIAALVLGVVILGVAIFVLLPLKRTRPKTLDGELDDDAIASEAIGARAVHDRAKLPAPMPMPMPTATLQPAPVPTERSAKVTKEPTVDLPAKPKPVSSGSAKTAQVKKAADTTKASGTAKTAGIPKATGTAKTAGIPKATGTARTAGIPKATGTAKTAGITKAPSTAKASSSSKPSGSTKTAGRPLPNKTPASKTPVSKPKIVTPPDDSLSTVDQAGD